MKRFLFSLLGFALLGGSPLLGQTLTPMPNPPGVPAQAPGGDVVPIPAPGNPAPGAAPMMVLPGGAPVGAPMMMGPGGGACGSGGCCTPTKTACVPESYTKKHVKWVFNSRCESLCLCYSTPGNLLGGLFGSGHGKGDGCNSGCGSCAEGHCERPYTRKYLVKKKRVCEEQDVKCVPQEVPACATGCCPAGGCAATMDTGCAAPVSAPWPVMPTAPTANPVPVMPRATMVPLPNNATVPNSTTITVPAVPDPTH